MKPHIITVNKRDPIRRSNFYYAQRVTPGPYSHTVNAFGGYDTASFTLNTTQTEAEDWFENGLMRDVKVFGSALDTVWEGFIDEIRITVGPLTATIGPLLDVANKVAVLYTPLLHGAAGDVTGSQTLSAWQEDTTINDFFGTMPKIINAGTITDGSFGSDDNVGYLRDTYLRDNKWPKTTESLSSSANRPVTVSVKCKGYFHLLNWYYYRDATGTIGASDKIIHVLRNTPNISWLSFGEAHIDSNTMLIAKQEISYRTAKTVIKSIVVLGDAWNNRWLFSVLANREVHYNQIPNDVEYMARVSSRGLVIRSSRQALIEPWRLLPGYWLSMDDFLVGRTFPALTLPFPSLHEDPRLMFVEKVTYRAPFGLQLQGGNTDEINQLLAQMGAGGMS